MPEYKIYLGSDHRGLAKKEELFPMLNECHENVICEDLGAYEYDENDDYNDAALKVAQKVVATTHAIGVLLCGSAHGVCMQANRVPGARAINSRTVDDAVHGRGNDHANIVCLSADELDVDTMEQIVKAFCHTMPKMDEKYRRRAQKLDQPVVKPDQEG